MDYLKTKNEKRKASQFGGRGKWGVRKVETEEGSDEKGVVDSVKDRGLYLPRKKVGNHRRAQTGEP